MDEIITEKNYPIRNVWKFKYFFIMFVGFILPFCLFLIFIVIYAFGSGASLSSAKPAFFRVLFALAFSFLIPGIRVIADFLECSNFHYSLEQHFLVLHQGIISKENRDVPYGRIQGVFVNQGLFDRIFSLASLTIEDFSDGGTSEMSSDGYVSSGKSRFEKVGFEGNKIHIPGLKKGDAEALKEVILQKVKENPIEDSQSGL